MNVIVDNNTVYFKNEMLKRTREQNIEFKTLFRVYQEDNQQLYNKDNKILVKELVQYYMIA